MHGVEFLIVCKAFGAVDQMEMKKKRNEHDFFRQHENFIPHLTKQKKGSEQRTSTILVFYFYYNISSSSSSCASPSFVSLV